MTYCRAGRHRRDAALRAGPGLRGLRLRPGRRAGALVRRRGLRARAGAGRPVPAGARPRARPARHADTRDRPRRGPTSTRSRPPTWSTRCARPTRRARGWPPCAPARSCWPPPGLLDGRRATTHWAHTAELAARHPRVMVDPDVLYVDDGSVLTSAGKAAAHGPVPAPGPPRPRRRRSPTPSPAAWSCRRTGPAARPSSSATPVPAPDDHPLADLFAWVMRTAGPAADRGGPGPPGAT